MARRGADSVDASSDAVEGRIDLVDGVAGLGTQGQVQVALNCQAVSLTGFLIELDVTWISALEQRVGFGLEGGGTLQIGGSFLEEKLLLGFDERFVKT